MADTTINQIKTWFYNQPDGDNENIESVNVFTYQEFGMNDDELIELRKVNNPPNIEIFIVKKIFNSSFIFLEDIGKLHPVWNWNEYNFFKTDTQKDKYYILEIQYNHNALQDCS